MIGLCHPPDSPALRLTKCRPGSSSRSRDTDKQHAAKQKSNQALSTSINAMARRFPPAFGIERTRLRLKQGQSEALALFFLPFAPVTYTARLVLEDPSFGSLVYEIRGTGVAPDASLRLALSAEMHQAAAGRELQIPPTNSLLESARKAYLDKHPLSRDKNMSATVKAMLDSKTRPDVIDYSVECKNPKVDLPRQFVLRTVPGGHQEALLMKADPDAPGRFHARGKHRV